MLITSNQDDSLIESKFNYSVSFTEHEKALREIENLKALQEKSNNKIASLEDEIKRLQEQLLLMQHRQFGKKSEIQVGEPVKNSDELPLQKVSGYTRRTGRKSRGRLVDTSMLPRHQFYYDFPEESKICRDCLKPLEKIGQDNSEQLEVLPMRLYVAEHIRYKYACRCCQTISMAPKEKAPIPKALAGGSLLTEIIVNKYQYHLPIISAIKNS